MKKILLTTFLLSIFLLSPTSAGASKIIYEQNIVNQMGNDIEISISPGKSVNNILGYISGGFDTSIYKENYKDKSFPNSKVEWNWDNGIRLYIELDLKLETTLSLENGTSVLINVLPFLCVGMNF